MSNYLSKPIQYSNTIDTSAIDLFGKVATMKQQKYDVAVNQIQNTLDQYGSLGSTMREYGKEYLASKLDEVTQVINQSGGRDLSRNGIAKGIQQQIKNVVQDKTVLNEMAMGQKLASFQKEVGKIKDKGDGKYSDLNYNDALQLAGVNEWANDTTGKINKIGNLNYNEYVEVSKLQQERAQKYSKEMSPTQYLGTTQNTDNSHPYDIQKFGQRISTDEIQRHLLASMDEKERSQMQINARASIGKMQDVDFNKYMQDFTVGKTEESKLNLAAMEAQFKGLSPEEQEAKAHIITEAKAGVAANEEKIKAGVYDRNEMYSVYAHKQTRDVASQWDKDIITDLKVDKMSYEMFKDDRDHALKLETLATAKKANNIAEGAALGTATDVIGVTEDKPKSDYALAGAETRSTAAALDQYLLQNDTAYKKLNDAEKWTYRMNLNANDPTITGNNPTYKSLVQDFQSAQKIYAKATNVATTYMEETSENVFNDMIRGKGKSNLNIDNLSATMPLVASILKGNSTKDYKSLPAAQKLGVMAEMTSNILQYDDSLSEDERSQHTKALSSYKSKLKSLNTTESNKVLKGVSESTSSKAVGGFWGNMADGLSSTFGSIIADPVKRAINGAVYLGEAAFNGESTARENLNKKDDELLKGELARDAQLKQSTKYYKDYFGASDSNITEIESRDLQGSNGKSGVDALQQFKEARNLAKIKSEEVLVANKPNLTQGKAFTFSTGDKAQKPVADALRAAVLNSTDKPEIPEGTNDFTIQREGTGFKVGYNKKIKGGSERTSVFIPTLPSNVSGLFSETKNAWKNDPKNKNITLVNRSFKPYTSDEIRNRDVYNASTNLADILSYEQRMVLEVSPESGRFATVSELKDKVKAKQGNDFYTKNITQIDEILNRTYDAMPKVTMDPQNPFWADIKFKKDGQTRVVKKKLIGSVNNDNDFYVQLAGYVYDLKIQEIEALR